MARALLLLLVVGIDAAKEMFGLSTEEIREIEHSIALKRAAANVSSAMLPGAKHRSLSDEMLTLTMRCETMSCEGELDCTWQPDHGYKIEFSKLHTSEPMLKYTHADGHVTTVDLSTSGEEVCEVCCSPRLQMRLSLAQQICRKLPVLSLTWSFCCVLA